MPILKKKPPKTNHTKKTPKTQLKNLLTLPTTACCFREYLPIYQMSNPKQITAV